MNLNKTGWQWYALEHNFYSAYQGIDDNIVYAADVG